MKNLLLLLLIFITALAGNSSTEKTLEDAARSKMSYCDYVLHRFVLCGELKNNTGKETINFCDKEDFQNLRRCGGLGAFDND